MPDCWRWKRKAARSRRQKAYRPLPQRAAGDRPATALAKEASWRP